MKHNPKIKVSVAMTTFNGEKYLQEQLDSILANLDEQDEIIIGDDGSTDETLKILTKYHDVDQRIRIVQNTRLGTTANLQKVISMCTGDIIFLCDQDDKWCTDKVSLVCTDFEKNPNIDLVFHNSRVSGSDINDIRHESVFEHMSVSDRFIRNVVFFRFWGCMMAFRKRAVQYLLPFRFGFDSWIMFCVTFFHKCYLEKKVLMTYRRHSQNQSPFKKRKPLLIVWEHLYRVVLFAFYLPIVLYKVKQSEKENA